MKMRSINRGWRQDAVERGVAGFSLIEMVGVMAILAMVVTLVAPNLIRKVVDTNATRESKNLQVLGEALTRYVTYHQVVPGGGTWVNDLAADSGMNTTEVSTSDMGDPVNNVRVYLVHPGFTPSTGTDPVFSMPSTGSGAPTDARVMIISSTKRGLAVPATSGKAVDTPANRAAFDAIWNWNLNPFTKDPPSGWPANWAANGEHLHVQRLNLGNLFVRVTFSNLYFPTNVPFARFNSNPTYPFDATNAVDAYYLKGTTVRLYRHDEPYVVIPPNPDELSLSHVLEGDVNFMYDGLPARWRVP